MKFADLLKQNTASTSAATITLGAAPTGFRTLAQAIAAGELVAGDQSTFMVRDAAGKYEFSLFTVTNATTLTRVEVRRSSNNGAAETFGTGATVTNMPDGEWLSQLLSAADGLEIASLPNATPTGAFRLVGVDGSGEAITVLVSALQTLFGGTAPPAATVSSVTVSPSAPSVAGGASQTFTAAVAGTNSPAQTVTWTASAGSITSGGVFTAPAATGSAQTITITARSTVDTTKTGTATVTVAATGTPAPTVSSVTVSPSTATVAGGATQQFSATVAGTNSPSQGVTWSASLGTINSAGLYTAPAATSSTQTATITATSTQDGTKSGTATVTVSAAAPQTMAQRYNVTAGATAPESAPYTFQFGTDPNRQVGIAFNLYVKDAQQAYPAAGDLTFFWLRVASLATIPTELPATLQHNGTAWPAGVPYATNGGSGSTVATNSVKASVYTNSASFPGLFGPVNALYVSGDDGYYRLIVGYPDGSWDASPYAITAGAP